MSEDKAASSARDSNGDRGSHDAIGSLSGMTEEPYGSWRSPITADLMLRSAVGLEEVWFDNGDLYWVEERPEERGRGVVVKLANGAASPVDVTPAYAAGAPYVDVRTNVYSYGGGAWLIDSGTVYFSNKVDGRLYRQDGSSAQPVPLTPSGQRPDGTGPLRLYADGCMDRRRNRWIGLREDWSGVVNGDPDERKRQPVHTIVALDLAGGVDVGTPIAAGEDFYAAPRLSPDGRWLAFLSWGHPLMPWQGTTLHIVELDDAGMPCAPPVRIAGSDAISVAQPEWSPDGNELWFISDESGWWNLYRYSMSQGSAAAVAPMEAEFAHPQWKLGASTYAFAPGGRVVAAYSRQGLARLAVFDRASGRLVDTSLPYTAFSSVRSDGAGAVAFVAGGSRTPTSIMTADLDKPGARVIKAATTVADEARINRHFSIAEPITYPTSGGQQAHALFYPPYNADYKAPAAERPPVIVLCHGGPTSQARTSLSLAIQYWTSRGIAVIDVNHRGSSGFGRAYRDLLELSWGIVEVEDCIASVKHMARQGRVDESRAVIKGGSAGGYTTLSALTFHDFFKAGSCHYGIGNLETLAQETHKFESHYLDWLIGPYPEAIDVYRARSPVFHIDRLNTPVIFFHGEDDPVVPPNQSVEMAESIRAKGLPFGCILFAAEQHGFREKENQRRAIEAEHDFLSFQVFRTKMLLGEPRTREDHVTVAETPTSAATRAAKTASAASTSSAGAGTGSPARAWSAPARGYSSDGAAHDHGGYLPGDPSQNGREFHASALIGTETLFASHLTMLHHETHMYQLVMQLSLPEPWRSDFIAERKANPTDSYFIANALADPAIGNPVTDPMTVAEIASRMRTSFVGNIFRGIPYRDTYPSWPWEGVRPVLGNVPVVVDRIVHFHPFAWTMKHPETLVYILFGAGDEAHMVNLQTRMPDFDHVLTLAERPTWLSEDLLRAGAFVDLVGVPRLGPDDVRYNVRCENPIADGSSVSVRYRCTGPARPVSVGFTSWFCNKLTNNPNPCSHSTSKCASETPPQYLSTA